MRERLRFPPLVGGIEGGGKWTAYPQFPPPLTGGGQGEGVIEMTPSTLNKKRLTSYAKSLRQNATQAEKALWHRLRNRQMEGIKFRRQQPIEGYIVDFVSFETRLVVELDGGQHAVERQKDIKRDRCLHDKGFTVLRFWNHEVLGNLDGVLAVIRRACLSFISPSPQPPPVKGGGVIEAPCMKGNNYRSRMRDREIAT